VTTRCEHHIARAPALVHGRRATAPGEYPLLVSMKEGLLSTAG
jgi:hypothetical protein